MVNDVLLVGVDVGGSKTQIRATHAGVAILDETCASDGWDLTSRPASALWLARLLITLLPVPSARPAHIVVGAHGSETPAHCEELATELHRHLGRAVTVVNDAELVVPAVGEPAGVGVIAGTGSIVVGRHSKTGHYLSAGGWGWVLGDEGSASALVREAVRGLLRAADLRPNDCHRPTDPVQDALLSSFHVPDLATLAAVMSSGDGVRTWGAHAPVLFTAASQGSTVATDVIQAGGRALAELVDLLKRRGAAGNVAVAAGGVICHQPSLWQAFTGQLAVLAPDMRARMLAGPPVLGALELARRTVNEALHR